MAGNLTIPQYGWVVGSDRTRRVRCHGLPVMPDWSEFWNDVDPAEVSSTLIAVVAAIVSVVSAVLTKRNVRAAERSAEAAEASSDAAHRQADASERKIREATVQAEIETLAAARLRVDEAAPDVSIAVLSADRLQAVHIFCEDEVRNWTPQAVPKLQILNMREHTACKLRLTLNGIVYNNSPLAIRAFCFGPSFQSGRHPLTGEELPAPHAIGI